MTQQFPPITSPSSARETSCDGGVVENQETHRRWLRVTRKVKSKLLHNCNEIFCSVDSTQQLWREARCNSEVLSCETNDPRESLGKRDRNILKLCCGSECNFMTFVPASCWSQQCCKVDIKTDRNHTDTSGLWVDVDPFVRLVAFTNCDFRIFLAGEATNTQSTLGRLKREELNSPLHCIKQKTILQCESFLTDGYLHVVHGFSRLESVQEVCSPGLQ